MPSSTLLNQTFTCSLRRYCDNRYPRTFLWVTFTVTASSQEQEREVRISETHVHWLPRGTSVQKRVFAACIIPILSSYFSHIVIHFVFRFGLLLFYTHMFDFVTTCLCAFIRPFCAFSSVKKTCGLRFHNTSVVTPVSATKQDKHIIRCTYDTTCQIFSVCSNAEE